VGKSRFKNRLLPLVDWQGRQTPRIFSTQGKWNRNKGWERSTQWYVSYTCIL